MISGWTADPDGDGAPNALEFVSNSDPRDGSERPSVVVRMATTPQGPALEMVLTRSSLARAFIAARFSDDLKVWTGTPPGGTTLEETATSVTVRATGGSGLRPNIFGRFEVLVP
jgi:hypothetical protein